MMRCLFRGSTLFIACLLGLTGCQRIPHRQPDEHFAYFSSRPVRSTEEEAQPSVYLDLADNHPAAHQVMLLNTGDDALLTRIHLIRAATTSIEIQTFIWREDPVTRVLFAELRRAAERGVRVRILVDALNPISGNTRLAEMALLHPNLELAVFRPLSFYTEPPTLNSVENLIFKARRLNRRMHNKLMLVDDKAGIVGGRNYESKYFDRHPEMIFKDRDVLYAGPATLEMKRMFERYWTHRDAVYMTQFKDVKARIPEIPPPEEIQLAGTGDLAPLQPLLEEAGQRDPAGMRPHLQFTEVAACEFYWDSPEKFHGYRDRQDEQFSRRMFELMQAAEENILVQTPYLIYQRKSRKRLEDLRKEVPDLQVWVSTNSLAAADHDMVYGVSYKHRKKLYKGMGLEIFEFSPCPVDLLEMVPRYPLLTGFRVADIEWMIRKRLWLALLSRGPKLTLHAKTFVIDNQLTKIGSHNFDPRSEKLNTECALVIDDRAFAEAVRADILRDMAPGNSWRVAKRLERENPLSIASGMLGTLSSMIPVFDIWPYHYTSNFQLREGFEPLPDSRHPDFYLHYKDIGQFPMISDSFGALRAQLMKVFAGWTGPFM